MYKLLTKPVASGLWRVNGTATVYRKRNTLVADFVFSKLLDNGLSEPFAKVSEAGELAVLSFPLSHMFFLRTGSLWLDGKNVSPGKTLDESYISFNASCAERVRLQDLPSVSYRLEKNKYAGHNLARSYALVLPLLKPTPSFRSIVIPCVELVRFYFGVSQRLIRHIAKGTTDRLIDWKNSYVKSGIPHLTLHRNVTRLESSLFAEALMSDAFRTSSRYISKSLKIQFKADPNDVFIDSLIPFEGRGDWKVEGINTKLQNGENAMFVTQLLRCWRQIEFSDLVCRRTIKLKRRRSGRGEGGSGCRHSHVPSHPNDEPEDNQQQSESGPDKRLRPASELYYSQSYESYYRVRRHNDDSIADDATPASPVKPIPMRGITYEESGPAHPGMQRQEGMIVEPNQPSRGLFQFIDMLRELEGLIEGSVLQSVPLFSHSQEYDGLYISFYEKKIDGLKNWHKVQDPESGVYRARGFVVASFERMGMPPFYLIELEKRQPSDSFCYLYAAKKDGEHATNTELESVMFLTARNSNWPFSLKKNTVRYEANVLERRALFEVFDFRKYRHPSHVDSLDEFEWAEQVLDRLPV